MDQPSSPLSYLPAEIVEEVLLNLSVPDLLRCRLVHRHLNDVISKSMPLQYRTDLFAAGLTDCPSQGIVAARLEKLRAHQAAWKSLKWSQESVIVLPNYAVFENFGGVFAVRIGTYNDGIRFIQLPSVLRGIDMRDWSIQNLGFHIGDFCMDPAADIVAVLDKRDDDMCSCIHLLTMSTGAPYPFATSPRIQHLICGSLRPLQMTTSMAFLGYQLGLLFFHEQTPMRFWKSEFIIWNWKTGIKVLELTSLNIRSFSFLDDTHVLVGLVQDAKVMLQVFDFGQQANGYLGNKAASQSCVALELPPPVVDFVDIRLNSDPSPLWSPNVEGPPFFCAPAGKVITISPTTLDLERASFVIVARQSNFLTYKHGTTVPWNSWGGSCVLLSPDPTDWSCRRCGVYGTKVITSLDFDEGIGSVLDFNTRSMRRATSTSSQVLLNSEEQSDAALSPRQDVSVSKPTDEKSVLYQNTTFRIPQHIDVEAYMYTMLSEDNIMLLMYRAEDNQDFVELHLLTF